MSLYRQLIIFTFVLFLLLFAGTWYAKLASTRVFLSEQLVSHAQDTATSLALSISPHVASQDLVAVEGMMNAVFDGGYYRIVRFKDPNNKLLIDRELPVKIEQVPSWFVALVPLKTPEAVADVMAGWKQGGTITVSSHPGYAYKTLWSDVVRMSFWFVSCALFVLAVGGLGLKVLLKPLLLVEKQADGLCRREYSIQEPLPWTREFRRVAEAMNRMTCKIREMFEEQATQAEGLRERAYHDQLTGLGNRRYLEAQVVPRLEQRDSSDAGGLLLVKIHDLVALNQQRGFQAGDELLQHVAVILREVCAGYPNAVLARLTGGDFAVFVMEITSCELKLLAAAIAGRLGGLAAQGVGLGDNVGHVGGVAFEGATTLARLLAETDCALSAAHQKGMNAWEVAVLSETSAAMPLGQQQWREFLSQTLQNRRIKLYAQPVVTAAEQGGVKHVEVFVKIMQDDGSLLGAATFMPLAERLGLVAQIDRLVIEELMALDTARLGCGSLAVNISPSSLRDEAFMGWLQTRLTGMVAGRPQICFEFSEFAAVQNLDLLKQFSRAVRELGHAVGLDHYGQSFSKLSYLQSIHPDYVKIDRGYTGDIKDEAGDSRFYIGALCSVAHSIDIEVVAEGIESELQAQVMRDLKVDALQGYWLGSPQPIESLLQG